jgi:hypothetical protein
MGRAEQNNRDRIRQSLADILELSGRLRAASPEDRTPLLAELEMREAEATALVLDASAKSDDLLALMVTLRRVDELRRGAAGERRAETLG